MSSDPDGLPAFPFVEKESTGLSFNGVLLASSGWQRYPIRLQPGEVAAVTLSGKVVYVHNVRRTAGACGSTDEEVDHREGGPAELPSAFALQVADTGELCDVGWGEVRDTLVKLAIPEASGLMVGDLRLAGVLKEARDGNPGDNSGNFAISVSVDPTLRIERFIAEIQAIQNEVEKDLDSTFPTVLAARLSQRFPLRLPSQEGQRIRAFSDLASVGTRVLERLNGDGIRTPGPWRRFAAWLGEWSVTPAAGGKADFGAGWVLRAKVALLEGSTEEAQRFFASAIQSTDGRDRISLFYELGKLRELSGILFSPRGKEVTTVEAMVARLGSAAPSAAERDEVGAYDYYRLALIGGMLAVTRVENQVRSDVADVDQLDRIKQYDVHYALGRLEYLRHTTESLERAAIHFRMCRRLSRFRYLTAPSLQASYTLAMLMDDVVRVQANPFHTGGRLPVSNPSSGSGADTLVGLLNVDVRVSTALNNAREGDDTKLVGARSLGSRAVASGFRWLPIGQQSAAGEVVEDPTPFLFNPNSKNGRALRDTERFLTRNELYRQLELRDEVLTEQGKLVVGALYDLRPQEGASGEPRVLPSVTEWVQNPLLACSFPLLERLAGERGSPIYPPVAAVDGDRLFLRRITSGGPTVLTLDFGDASGNQITAGCRVQDTRLRLERLVYGRSAPGAADQQRVAYVLDLIYEGVDTRPGEDSETEATQRIREMRLWLAHAVRDAAGALNQTAPQPAAREATPPDDALPDVWIRFQYHDAAPRLVRAMDVDDRRIARMLNDESGPWWQHRVELVPTGTAVDGDAVLERDVHLIGGAASLASAYLPFHLNLRPESLRQVQANDMRWALRSRALPAALVRAFTEELGRRVAEPAAQAPDEDERAAFAILYDIAAGHYDSFLVAPLLRGAAAPPDLAEVHALAASALLSATADGRGGGIAGSAQARPRAVQAAFRTLAALAPDVDPGRAVRIAAALARFPQTLESLQLDPPIAARASNGSGGAGTVPERGEGVEGALTGAWLDALVRSVGEPRLALALARPVVASGMATLAYDWIVASSGFAAAGELPEVARWLASGVLPDERTLAPLPRARLDVLVSKVAAAAFHLADPAAGASLAAVPSAVEALERELAAWQRSTAAEEDPASSRGARILAVARGTLALLAEQLRGASEGAAAPYRASVLVLAGAGIALWRRGGELAGLADEVAVRATSIFRAIRKKEAPGGAKDEATGESADAEWERAVRALALPERVSNYLLGVEVAPEPADPPLEGGSSAWLRADRAGLPILHTPGAPRVSDEIDGLMKVAPPPVRAEGETAGAPVSDGRILPVTLAAGSLGAWETILHDEPFADSCVALLALANRYVARGDARSAGERLHEALCALVKLAADNEGTTSPADRAQVNTLLRRVQLRLAWLDQGCDPYGRFLTQAPPRRLRVLTDQFRSTLDQYRRSLDLADSVDDRMEARLREELLASRQRTDAAHRIRQVRLQQERYTRSLADIDQTLSAINGRRREVGRQLGEALQQFNDGKHMQSAAAADIGKLVMQSALQAVPAGALAHARKAAESIRRMSAGENPLRAALGVYGEEVVALAFGSYQQEDLFRGRLQGEIGGAFEEYVSNGRVGFDDLARRSIKRAGGELLDNAVERFGRDVEELVRSRVPFGEIAEVWNDLKNEADGAAKQVLKTADDLRGLVSRYQLTGKANEAILKKVLAANVDVGGRALKDMVRAEDLVRALATLSLPTSTVAKSEMERLRDDLKNQLLGFRFVDVPVSGLDAGAASRSLRGCALILRAVAAETTRSSLGAARHRSLEGAARKLGAELAARLGGVIGGVQFPIDRLLDLEFTTGSNFERGVAEIAAGSDHAAARARILLATIEARMREAAANAQGQTGEALAALARILETVAEEVDDGIEALGRERFDDLHAVVRSFLDDGIENFTGTSRREFQEAFKDALLVNEDIRTLFLEGSRQFVQNLRLSAETLAFLAEQMGQQVGGRAGLLGEILARTEVALPPGLKLTRGLDDLVAGERDRYRRTFAASALIATEAPAPAGAELQGIRGREDQLKETLKESLAEPNDEWITTSPTGEGAPLPPDKVNELMANPSAQAILMAVSAAYPVAGLLIQGATLINDWLVGGKNRELGAAVVEAAEAESRVLDRDAREARHQRELLELELAVARDEQARLEDDASAAEALADLADAAAERAIHLRRSIYRRTWTQLELLTYQLYLLQRGFEYEFDAPLAEMFQRWPQLDPFRALLELSPGTTAGEFDRTNVHRDMLLAADLMEAIPEALQLVRDLVATVCYRDSITISLRHDYPDAWAAFRKHPVPSTLRFRTTLAQVGGVRIQGRGIRHSFKIEQVTVHPRIESSPPIAAPEVSDSVVLFSPKTLGDRREANRLAEAHRAALLAQECPDRLKLVLFHAGTGDQLDEWGALRRIEWGPQVIDSNLIVAEADKFYNAAEGLTPASDWALIVDPESPILTSEFQDIRIQITYTYRRDEESVRVLHRTLTARPPLRLGRTVTAARVTTPALPATRSREVGRALRAAQVEEARRSARALPGRDT